MLLALAEQLGNFTGLVGGPGFCLLFAISLGKSSKYGKNSYLRQVCGVSEADLPEHTFVALEAHFLLLVKCLWSGNYFISCTLACDLFSACYPRTSNAVKTEIRQNSVP